MACFNNNVVHSSGERLPAASLQENLGELTNG